MKVSCLQENLARGLSIVGRAVATRSTLPVLSNILLATDENRLKLAATNLEIGINCWIGARVDEDGAVTIPARLLSDFVNSLPQDRVDMEFSVRTQQILLHCARFEAKIKTIDAQEFPLLPTATEDNSLKIAADVLKRKIEQVIFAAATDESRPILTGVFTRFDGTKLTFAAADGFRLAVAHAELQTPVLQPFTAIIPARAMAEVARVIGDQDEPVSITITPARNQVLFHMANVDLVSQLIEGNFPDYNMIVPKSHNTRTIADTRSLLQATKTANIFARDAANIVRIEAVPGRRRDAGQDDPPGHRRRDGRKRRRGGRPGGRGAHRDRVQRSLHHRRAVRHHRFAGRDGDQRDDRVPASSSRSTTMTSCASSCPCTLPNRALRVSEG